MSKKVESPTLTLALTLAPAHAFVLALIMLLFFSSAQSMSAASGSNKFDEYYNQAVESYARRRFQEAISFCDSAIKEDPARYEPYLKKARALNEIGKAKEGLAEFNRCLKLKQLGEIYQSRGLSYRMLENYSAALSDWWRCIKLDPDYEKAYWRIEDLQLSRNQYGDCFKVYAKAIANKSTAARAFRKRGQLYARLNKYSKALDDHATSLKLKPHDATTFYSRAKIHSQFKRYDLAVSDMHRAIELDPKNSSRYTVLGAFLTQSGKLQEAAVVLDKAIALEPGSASAHNNRGVVYEKMGELEKAKSEFDLAVEHDPGRAIYYANHARVAVVTGDPDDAVDDFVNLDRKPVDAPAGAADVNYKLVISQFDKVIKLNPEDAANYYNRGVAFYCSKNYKQAQRDFDQFIKMSKWNGDAPFYAAVLDAAALRTMHKPKEARDVLAEAEKHDASTWSKLLIQGVLGTIPSDELLQAARLHNKEFVARCFLGLTWLTSGRSRAALDQLEWVRKNADSALDEYSLAASHLPASHLPGAKAKTGATSARTRPENSPPTLIVK